MASRKGQKVGTKLNVFWVNYFHLGISQHLRSTLTFQLEQEAETSTDPPLGQRSVCSWSYSSPLEGWSSLWLDTCVCATHHNAKFYSDVIEETNVGCLKSNLVFCCLFLHLDSRLQLSFLTPKLQTGIMKCVPIFYLLFEPLLSLCVWKQSGLYLLEQSDIFAVCLLNSLELELSGELVLSLLQLLSAPHMLVIHVLDLRLNALELGIQLQGDREKGRDRQGEEVRCCPARCSRWWTGQLAAAWLSVATALEALVSGEMGSQ